jgi:hypothetical protein
LFLALLAVPPYYTRLGVLEFFRYSVEGVLARRKARAWV